jgi:glycosyltransferase 2 family protein
MPMNVAGKTRLQSGIILRLAISLVLIACIVWWLGGPGKILAIVRRVDLRLAALVIIVFMLDRALMTFKWLLLLRARDIHQRFFRTMKIYCASMVWGMFLPSTIGADTIRAVSVANTGINTNEVVASIVIERVFGFLSTLFVGLCSLLLLWLSGELESRFVPVWWAALIMITSSIIALAMSLNEKMFRLLHERSLGRFRHNRIARKLKEFHETYLQYRKHPGALINFSLLTIAEQLVAVALLWTIALSLGIHLGIFPFLVAVPLSFLVSRLPIGVYGLGTFEAAFIFLLAEAGLSGADAVAISFTGRILEVLAWLPWWFAHVISTGRVQAASEKMYPEPVTAELGSDVRIAAMTSAISSSNPSKALINPMTQDSEPLS